MRAIRCPRCGALGRASGDPRHFEAVFGKLVSGDYYAGTWYCKRCIVELTRNPFRVLWHKLYPIVEGIRERIIKEVFPELYKRTHLQYRWRPVDSPRIKMGSIRIQPMKRTGGGLIFYTPGHNSNEKGV